VLPLTGREQKYTVKGYCYSGGGRKVIRVELSIDGGKTWTLTNLTHPEKPTEYGRYWCWCFWELEVDVKSLYEMEGAELLCRGWDAAMNRQPEMITWNVMGMMNNSYFRIKVHRCFHPDTNKPALRFQHPTLAGPGNFGGWFEEKSLGKADAAVLAAVAPPPPKEGAKVYTMAEVEKHTDKEDVWFVVKNKVYNGTGFLEDHPGGGSSILIVGGTDCTDEFEALHSSKAWKLLDDYYIGELAGSEVPVAAPTAPTGSPAADESPTVLKGGKWVSLPLKERKELSHDTRLFRFALPSEQHVLGLPVGQHLFLKGKDLRTDKMVMRAYTPVGAGPGYVDFVIKVYFANVHPRFPDGGALTQFMESLKIGDTIDFKGPMGEFEFNTTLVRPDGLNTFTQTMKGSKQTFRNIGFISGGSGITPSLQTAVALLKNPETQVKVWILYANQKEADILCRDILDELEKDDRVNVWYTVDRSEEGWKYSTGFIDENMVRDHLPPPADNTVVFMCGPPPMLKFACIPNLNKVGHAETNYFSF